MKKIIVILLGAVIIFISWKIISRRATFKAEIPETNNETSYRNKDTSKPSDVAKSDPKTQPNQPANTPPVKVESSHDETYSFITPDGRTRIYKIHIPEGYISSKKYPLLVHLHGGGAKIEMLGDGSTGFNSLSDKEKFLTVYPAGTGGSSGMLTWNAGNCCGYAVSNNVDDVSFIREVISRVIKNYAVDQSRVFIAGMSNGAMMAQRMACEATDLFAGAGTVSGPQEISTCNPSHPIPVMMVHGTADTNVPYLGGKGESSITQVDYNPIESTLKIWADRNKCSSSQIITSVAPLVQDGITIDKIGYSGCSASVVLYRINGGTHSWPGGTPGQGQESRVPTKAFDASNTILKFFGIISA